MNEKTERDIGPQPIAAILAKHNLKPHDLVAASTHQLTHKMVSRACLATLRHSDSEVGSPSGEDGSILILKDIATDCTGFRGGLYASLRVTEIATKKHKSFCH